MKHNWDLVGKHERRYWNSWNFPRSWINQSVACCAYRKFSRRWRQQPVISRIIRTCMTNLRWFPRKQRKIFLNSRLHLLAIARESERESHFQHPEHMLRDDTKMVLTSFQHYCRMSNMNVLKHGENKDVIDGLNNKLIQMLQEDGPICCRNKAEVLVWPKEMMMHSSENHE
jgi:hypothetical protein